MQYQIISRYYGGQRTGFDLAAFQLGKDITGFTQRPGDHGFYLLCLS